MFNTFANILIGLYRINSLLNETYWNVDDEEGKLSQLIALPSSISLLANATKFLTHPNLTELMENGLRVQDIIRSPSDLKTILVDEHGLAPGVVDAVMQSRIDMARVLSLVGYRDIKAVVCTVEQLGQFLVTPSRDQIINVSSSLCNLPQTEVLNITRVFVSSIDPISLFDKVSDVLKAIGGYQAESLVKELGSMLASLGRLEALAPLATMLDSLSTYISPMISAVNILYDTGWNSESLAKLMSIAEDFMKLNSTPTTAALYSPKSASVLLTPKGLMRIAEEDYKTEPWKNLLNTVSAVVSQMGFELETITQELTKIPETHSLLMLATALLPELIGPDPLNITRWVLVITWNFTGTIWESVWNAVYNQFPNIV
ncbi:hypothetical protein SK128_005030 [Halocaridina rubra]|uniref:Uncharacterized protein n=1 Tax=Halocaridina rubra TaxID=373956 RepID=A0AAN8WZ36_HALRR